MEPLVNVHMVAYNHAQYIEQAIEGVLMQKTTFPFNLIIGEDKSTDNTLAICRGYQEKFPDKIVLVVREQNTGMAKNFCDLIDQCTAKYVAFCEGDDYWTDPLKLQKQFDFLEKNTDFALCYHHVKIIQQDSFQNRKLEMKTNQPEVSTIEAILKKNIWAHLNSILYRRELLSKCPSWMANCPSLDWAILATIIGGRKIKYMNETMSVYRQHGGGIWSGNTIATIYKNTLKSAKVLKKHIERKYRKYLQIPVRSSYEQLSNYYRKERPLIAAYYFFLYRRMDLRNYITYKIQAITKPYRKSKFEKNFRKKATKHIPLLIFQMGKVGSASIYNSALETYPGDSLHIHGFDNLSQSSWPTQSFYNYAIRYKQPIKIISLTREPVGRNVSAFFQNIELITGKKYSSSMYSTEELKTIFFENPKMKHDEPLTWFDVNLLKHFNIDVYQTAFPADGWQIIKKDNIELLLMKSELTDATKETLIRKFLNYDKYKLSTHNVSSEKNYAADYKKFKNEVKFPVAYLDYLLNSKYARHFYSKNELLSSRIKWQLHAQANSNS
jgi:glycosyltransferase involved in cell wall biosynthesis